MLANPVGVLSMTKVIDFPLHLNEGETYADLDPDKILKAAVGELKEVVIVGYKDNGDFYFASTRSSGPDTLWLLAQAQSKLLAVG